MGAPFAFNHLQNIKALQTGFFPDKFLTNGVEFASLITDGTQGLRDSMSVPGALIPKATARRLTVLLYDGWLPGDGFGDQFLFGPSGSPQKTCKVAKVPSTKQHDELGQSQRLPARARGERRKMTSHSHSDYDCIFTPTKMETLSAMLS